MSIEEITLLKDGQFSEKYDWGWALQPSDPWRTPSYGDWDYLFNTRTMTNGKPRYTKTAWDLVKIDGIAANGIFIYPDDFNGKPVDESGSNWTWSGLKNAEPSMDGLNRKDEGFGVRLIVDCE